MSRVESSAEKSTNVRSKTSPTPFGARMGEAWLRLQIRALAAVSPETAASWVFAIFSTPQRRRTRPPEVEGLQARSFVVKVDGAYGGREDVVAWRWGTGPTVLLCHGWEGHAGQMTKLVRPLVDRGWSPVALDMPAHGASTGRRTDVLGFAAAIAAVADVAGDVRAVVGHSLGATATSIALWQATSAGSAATSAGSAGALSSVRRAALVAPGAEPTHFARQVARFVGLPAAPTELFLDRVRARVGSSGPAPLGGPRQPRPLDVREMAPSLRPRALVLHDPADAEVPFAHGEGIAAAWPGAELVAVGGAGHRRIVRDEGVVRRIVTFVGSPADTARGG